jgi:hypothetical protein
MEEHIFKLRIPETSLKKNKISGDSSPKSGLLFSNISTSSSQTDATVPLKTKCPELHLV